LVGPPPAPRRLPQPARLGPFAELDLSDELGCQPVRVPGLRRRDTVERARLSSEPSDDRPQLLELLVVKSGADLAHIAQPAVVGDAEEQRTHAPRTTPPPWPPPGDDHLLSAMVLDLDPGSRAAPWRIAGAAALGHDAL